MSQIDSMLDLIDSGHFDDELDVIVDAVRTRRKDIGRERIATLKVGDRVVIRDDANAKQKYIIGYTGVVVEKKVSKIMVRFDDDVHDPYNKYAGAKCNVPAEWLDKLDEEVEPGGAVVTELPIR